MWARFFPGVSLDEYYEKVYLDKVMKKQSLRPKLFLRYKTGRGSALEDPRNILLCYNDLKTKPSESTIDYARQFFLNLVDGIDDEHLKVKRVAAWVNAKTEYAYDSERWGSNEYWSSPFDLWQQYLKEGKMVDDCDGSAVMIYWACRLVGVSEERLYIWGGYAVKGKKKEAHANLVYAPIGRAAAHVEGSWYPDLNQSAWLGYEFGKTLNYISPWIMFNEVEIRT